MSVVIANRQRVKKINTRLLKQITNALLVELKISEAELGINLVAAKEMAKMNWKFLQHEGSTDVITFDHRNCELQIANRESEIYGELLICMEEALLQARQFKTDWQSEVVRYIVHGVLHLIGHDDHRVAARRRMKREENRLLRVLSKKFSLAQIGGGSKLRV